MLVNICRKLHEGILNVFLSYRADTTISQNLLFSISKGCNSENTQSRVTVLVLYICIKFHENISNDFLELQSGHDFVLENGYLQSSKGHNSKSINTKIIVLAFCMSSNVFWSYTVDTIL